jgi:hypothetical protein
LDIRVHFVKENETLSKDAKSQVKFMHDIRLAMARTFRDSLRPYNAELSLIADGTEFAVHSNLRRIFFHAGGI